ncbi:hypothetical protein SAMN04487828_0081 [Prevotella sp. lc2012]|nr:hypothetical protein SAMN04487828_0081 [Prevotella sp. lc2012]
MAAFVLAMTVPAAAQDTYESARLLGSDLNGTARYVGMGGAMDALGADISTMGTNPAGIGLFRHSTVSASLGLVSQQDAQKFDGLNKTNMSFDQLGFVYSTRISRTSFVNVGFNYHKSKNFDQILSAANRLVNCSQNGLSYHKDQIGYVNQGGYYLDFNTDNDLIGYESQTSDYRAQTFTQADYLNANVLMLDPDDHKIYYNDANGYTFDRAHRGWINDYDVNLSGNVNDRFYWGFTIGFHDVRYKGYSEYGETLVAGAGNEECGSVVYGDQRDIKGTGIDLKAGIIFRPVEESPFRLGLSVATPTWYDLTTSNETYMLNNSRFGQWDNGRSGESYDFHFNTPWKFGLSMGHVIGGQVAIGAGYEYTDYSASQNRINSGNYDYYGEEDSYTDEIMKVNTERSLKGVSTFKVGMEIKPDPTVALRIGYNYVTAGYEKDGVRDTKINSPGVAYASTTDYTNWKDTHRLTLGMGYRLNAWNVDLAYQYSATNGDFHPFQEYPADPTSNYAGQRVFDSKVSNKRHQLLLTVGYTF